tara:strand:- start:2322 stop:2768 length:447 start_codon:yes stop_codon:yes gene_type:complete
MDTWKQAGIILAISAVGACLCAFFHPLRPPWYRVSGSDEVRWKIGTEEAKHLALQSKILWVDARSQEKFDKEHLPGAILLNVSEWGDLMYRNMDELQEAMSHPVIVYCDGDDCRKSAEVGQRLRELLGLDPVYVLDGDWRQFSVPSDE